MSTDKKKVTRKLSAILSADVKGYSILMADDEVHTIETLKAYRGIISDLVSKHSGRVVDSPGDNILAEFRSSVDAVECAVKIQKALDKENSKYVDDKKVQFRIGVNIGDVIQDGDRIYGNGVNVAARIEGLADPGGVCISRNVYNHVGNKLSLGYEYLGEHTVKNIKKPVRVYKLLLADEDAGKLIGVRPKPVVKNWIWATIVVAAVVITSVVILVYQNVSKPEFEPAKVEEMAYPLPEKPSIAVLPFDNMSGDPEQNYFSDGLTEQVISALSKVHNLFVIARNSTFTYKGKPVKVQQVAEELGVRYVLEGSVQKAEDRVRITLQLIDALKGHHLWSESYDRNLQDIFALQDEIAMKVVTAMRVKLTVGEQARMFGKGTKNLKAYLKLLEAVEPFFLFKKEANVRAKQLLEEAIALDPEFSNAYSFLGFCHYWDGFYGWSKSTPKSNKRAFELSQKALTLDDSNAQAYEMISKIYVMLKKYEMAIAEAQKAVELNPNGTWFVFNMGWVLRCAGRPEEAIALLKKSIRLNPISKSPAFDTLGRAYFLARRYEEAIAAHKTAIKLDPDNQYAHIGLAATYTVLGKEGEARTEVSEILRIEPGFSIKNYAKFMYFQVGLEPEIEALRKAGIPEYPPTIKKEKPSIAVLPFDNLSDDPEQGYLADGLTDELIGDLAKIEGVFVISRNSAFTYKGKDIKIPEVAKELNVRYVLEGSVQRAGNRLRIRAQLIDGKTDHHVWAESYDGDGTMDNIFELQDEITGKIVAALALHLSATEHQNVIDKGTKSVAAYDAYLKGLAHMKKFTPEDYVEAILNFNKAIEIDSNYSEAYAALAYTYWSTLRSGRSFWVKIGETYQTSMLRARHYLEISMKRPTQISYTLKANMELKRRNFSDAREFAEKAVAITPNNPTAYNTLALVLGMTGKPEQAIELYKKAIMLDPLYQTTERFGLPYFWMKDYENTIKYVDKGIKSNPYGTPSLAYSAAAHAYLGNKNEAKNDLEGWLSNFQDGMTPPAQLIYYLYAMDNIEVFERFINGLVKAGLKIDPTNYYSIRKENRLSGKEIQRLLFGHKVSGYNMFGNQWSSYRSINGEIKLEYPAGSKPLEGITWIEDNSVCNKIEGYYGGLKDCVDVYKNPEGEEMLLSEYLLLSDLWITPFSIIE